VSLDLAPSAAGWLALLRVALPHPVPSPVERSALFRAPGQRQVPMVVSAPRHSRKHTPARTIPTRTYASHPQSTGKAL
jgi:hypothetical protein